MTTLEVFVLVAVGVIAGVVLSSWWEARNRTVSTELGIGEVAPPYWALMFFGGGPLDGEKKTVSLTGWLLLDDEQTIPHDGGYYQRTSKVVYPDAGGLAQFEWREARTVAA